MKPIVPLFLALILAPGALAQKPVTPPSGSPLRKAILDGLRPAIEKDLKLRVEFVVKTLNVLGDWAFLDASVQKKGGGKIDFTRTRYAEAIRAEAFGGPTTFALMRRRGKSWKPVDWVVGPSDVTYAGWAKQYDAPRRLFPYND